jgi:tetratricopeptide (TPR) repeat protein
MSPDSTPPGTNLPAIDSLWNFADPAATESRFRELLPEARKAGDPNYLSELLTQIARAEGLQHKFDQAHATLDQADALITPGMKAPRVRSLLERGRVLNSSKRSPDSIPVFEQALRLAQDAGLEYYAVDAAHMLGIAARGEESLRWNETAMTLAEAAADPRARRWLGPLYNNTAWTCFDMKRYPEALRLFEKDIALRSQGNDNEALGIARWSRAKVLRHLGRIEEALTVQLDLLQVPELQGGTNEGYTQEEIAECLLLLGRESEAKPHFARAWELLHEDQWLCRDEPERLGRLKQLG